VSRKLFHKTAFLKTSPFKRIYLAVENRNEQSELVGQKLMFTGSMVHGSGLFNFTRGTVEHKVIFTFSDPKLDAILHGINLIKVVRILIEEVSQLAK
jgi:uncharacterized membrane protein